MELSNNQVIQLRNGKCGVVASFNDKPFPLACLDTRGDWQIACRSSALPWGTPPGMYLR